MGFRMHCVDSDARFPHGLPFKEIVCQTSGMWSEDVMLCEGKGVREGDRLGGGRKQDAVEGRKNG